MKGDTEYKHGHLPAGWVKATLREIAHLNPRLLEAEPNEDELVSFVPMAAVEAESGRMDPSSRRLWKEVRKGYTRFQEGDVLFAKITPCMENGKFAIAKDLFNGRAAGSTEFHVIRPKDGVDRKLLLYFLLRTSLRQDARIRMKGAAGQLRVPPEFLAEIEFPIPPVREQRRIVAEIEKQFTRLDAAVEALKRVRANLKRYRASVLKASCEGRLVPTEAELARREGRSYEPASKLLKRIVTERRAHWEADQLTKFRAAGKEPKDDRWKAKYKEPVAPNAVDLTSLPEGWSWASLEQLSAVFVDSAHRTPRYGSAGLPALGPRDVVYGVIDLESARVVDEKEFSIQTARRIPQAGDVVYSRELSYGWAALVPENLRVCLSQGMCLFRPHDSVLVSFLLQVLNGPPGRDQASKYATGSAHPHINLSDIKAYHIPLPPLAEQHRIIAESERRLSVIDELEMQVEADLKRADRLRQAILKRAFEGKLVPQNPEDEPASILLERIRAERGKPLSAAVTSR